MRTALLLSLVSMTVLAAPQASDETVMMGLEGLIEPSEVRHLGLPVFGRLETVAVEVGDHITKGQVLAELESSVIDARIKVAEAKASQGAELSAAQMEFNHRKKRAERFRDLFENGGAVSKEELEEEERLYEQAKASLEKVQEALRIATLECEQLRQEAIQRRIVSPVNGRVLDKLISPGELVSDAAAVVIKVAVLDPLYVEMLVPMKYYGRIEEGMLATVKVETPIRGSFPAVVDVVEPVIHAATGTFKVRLTVQNKDYQIPAGLRCRVEFGS